MKLFTCTHCQQVVFFENVTCERCGAATGYEPGSNTMIALERAGDVWKPAGSHGPHAGGPDCRYCDNYRFGVCNWLVRADNPETYCLACRHNETVPDPDQGDNLAHWQAMEIAKRRLFYTLLQLQLPLTDRRQDPNEGLGFDFLAEGASSSKKVMTGHDEGLITIALAEADEAERVRRRQALGEPYRTLLGHFRHEVGHWYWDRLVRDSSGNALAACRALFGDDTEDYAAALKRHYENGPRPDWQQEFVSSYAGAHAWEDFAETWAHYLHIIDSLDTGRAWGVRTAPGVAPDGLLATDIGFDAYGHDTTVTQIADAWLALSAALNSFNRSMGHGDLYPFVLSPKVIEKLGFIHDLVRGRFGGARFG
ncbi:zinc-binding metallopeptidase family protein [Pseudohoeflea coraliihabitans]|uniref:Zinc-binding metallopeptidase n=1 Tax=Pseudohoeflea coraliihabitans TaxID=2860393 RepID=A0ABS6WLS8_9HYPH|nr:putative zinc-binding metallopeptidase [Pseudohoeflea sp. DP4N28-3]MBW3096909.1 putative zinc-binding metallopeptidase [Pseudohoeflea sp. DP4N28-3]